MTPLLFTSLLVGLVSAIADQPLQHVLPGVLPGFQSQPSQKQPADGEVEFRLAHIFHHGTTEYPGLHRKQNIKPDAPLWLRDTETGQLDPLPALTARQSPLRIQRLADRSRESIHSLLETARMVGKPVSLPASAWTIDDVAGPNITDKQTVVTMVRAAANAYVEIPWTGEWEDVKGGFNYTEDFGWQEDGIRGHIYADKNNETILVGLKGTTVAVWDGSGTTTKDKLNDNLFFGCCCGEGSYWTKKPCYCSPSPYTCNATCVADSLRNKNRYYYSAIDMYNNITEMYPGANIWLAGHSLGGAVASLLGMTFGLPVVTIEAPGEAMAASRLGLPTPPGYRIGDDEPGPSSSSFHFGHNADPLFTGTCGSACYAGGYAMESVCHSGMECVYNTTGELGWGPHLFNHGVRTVLHQVVEYFNETAKCEVVRDCNDCFNWKYFESNHSETTTSSSTSSSYSRTRTETCKTPGWFGCLDETTTTTSSSSSTPPPLTTPTSSLPSTSSTSSSCKTPGRFWGCRDSSTPAAAAARGAILTATATGAFGSWYAHELVDALR